jgi:hypothetical protein
MCRVSKTPATTTILLANRTTRLTAHMALLGSARFIGLGAINISLLRNDKSKVSLKSETSWFKAQTEG